MDGQPGNSITPKSILKPGRLRAELNHNYLNKSIFKGNDDLFLIEIYKQYKFCNIDVYVINHAQDVRYHETKMCTHDGKEIECIQSKTIQIYKQRCYCHHAHSSNCSK